MILYKNSKSYDILKIIEKFVAFAWDCGLNLGLRVVNIDNIDEMYDLAKMILLLKLHFLNQDIFLVQKDL